jgi:hypothetical protein
MDTTLLPNSLGQAGAYARLGLMLALVAGSWGYGRAMLAREAASLERMLSLVRELPAVEAMETLVRNLHKTKSNAELLLRGLS